MYKVTYLERIKINKKGDQSEPIFHTAKYGESEIDAMAERWRSLGVVKVTDIEVVKGKLTRDEVIDLFYPEKNKEGTMLDEADQKIKSELKKTRPDEKEYRKELFGKIEALGGKVNKLAKTEKLEEQLKELNKEGK